MKPRTLSRRNYKQAIDTSGGTQRHEHVPKPNFHPLQCVVLELWSILCQEMIGHVALTILLIAGQKWLSLSIMILHS